MLKIKRAIINPAIRAEMFADKRARIFPEIRAEILVANARQYE
jgi:hypothetical protein